MRDHSNWKRYSPSADIPWLQTKRSRRWLLWFPLSLKDRTPPISPKHAVCSALAPPPGRRSFSLYVTPPSHETPAEHLRNAAPVILVSRACRQQVMRLPPQVSAGATPR